MGNNIEDPPIIDEVVRGVATQVVNHGGEFPSVVELIVRLLRKWSGRDDWETTSQDVRAYFWVGKQERNMCSTGGLHL
jgi:hypothetical protein